MAQGAALSLALLIDRAALGGRRDGRRLSSMAQSGGYLLALTGPLVMGTAPHRDWRLDGTAGFLVAVAVVIWVPGTDRRPQQDGRR